MAEKSGGWSCGDLVNVLIFFVCVGAGIAEGLVGWIASGHGIPPAEVAWYWKVLALVGGLVPSVVGYVLLMVLLSHPLTHFLAVVAAQPLVGIFLIVALSGSGSYLWLLGLGVVFLGACVFFGYNGVQKSKAPERSYTFVDRDMLKRALSVGSDWELDEKLNELFRQAYHRLPTQQERSALETHLRIEIGMKLDADKPDPKKGAAMATAGWMLNCLYSLLLGVAMLIAAAVVFFTSGSPSPQPAPPTVQQGAQ